MVYYLILNSGEYWFQLLFLGELSQPGGKKKSVNWTKNFKNEKKITRISTTKFIEKPLVGLQLW
jgi:hypothetical protein